MNKKTNVFNNAIVYTLFPAIAKKDLDKTIIDELTGAQKTLQLKTFKPKPPQPKVTVPPYAGGCPGNLIDFAVECTTPSGDVVCSNPMIAVPVEEAPDEYKTICDSGGCRDDSSSVDVSQNEDPCKKYLEQKNIPTQYYNNPDYQGPGGSMNCSLNTCAC